VSLGDLIEEKNDRGLTLNKREVTEIARKIAEVLVYFEGKVCHSDIKPSNIIVADNGEITIIDYDTMLGLDKEGKAVAVHSFGTPEYAAKEQFIPGTPVTSTTDIHAFGVMIYELLTDEGQSMNNLSLPLLDEQDIALRFPKIRELPIKWQKIIYNCTLHDPSKRWDANEVLSAINSE
jgi:serine/threonine-protein kinase